MNLLAIETTTAACSVALLFSEQIRERHEVRPREHTQLLVPMVTELLDEAQLRPADLDAVVLGNGPGSFIGMRIGASVAQGLAFAAGVPLAPVSSLAAVATEVHVLHQADAVAVAQDARMNEVYFAQFEFDGRGACAPTHVEAIHSVGELPILGAAPLAAGGAWQRYPELLELNGARLAGVVEIQSPQARFLLPLGRTLVEQGRTVDPSMLEPAYLRETVAEIPGQ